MCLFYNATGDPVNFVKDYNWNGHILGSFEYPISIVNGQWGAFLHVKKIGGFTI